MSSKASKSMKNNEKTDLQKQIGCITGLFQLFDRHRFLAGGSNDQIRELSTTMPKAKAKNLKAAREKQQFPTKSSISCVSTSSCSSSMSSVDFSRTVQVEASSIPHIKVPGIPTSEAAPKQLENPGRRQSRDSRANVRDSKHREAQGLTVKTVAKEGKKGGHTLKYIDSPRPEPFQASKSANAGVMAAKEPLHILPRSQKAPWDSPRLSYDERFTQDTFKSTARHKELPRLSLDSRAGSVRSLNEGAKSRNLLKGPQKGYGSCSAMVNQLQEPETSRRQSSVVAKLMGLDDFPDCTQTREPMETSSCPTNKKETLSRDSTSDERKQHQNYGSPRICKGSTLLHHVRTDSTLSDTSYLSFLQEPTRGRQPDASQGSQFSDSKDTESAIKASNSSQSVYAEVEKRLAELEFKKSGKDLRALKQILEAMQRYNHSLDITRDQASNCPSDKMSTSSLSESSKVQSPRNRQKDPKSISTNRSNSPRESKLPIVIMTPARVKRISASPEMSIHGKSGPSEFSPCNPRSRRLVDRQKDKSITPKIRHLNDPSSQAPHSADKSDKITTSKMMEARVRRHIDGENVSSGNKTEIESPRLHKKFGWERRSLPNSCSSSDRRWHNRRSLELSSPSTTRRPKFSTLHEANERFSTTICPRKGLKDNVDVISPDSYTNKRSVTHSNIRVIPTDQSEISRISFLLDDLNPNKAAKGLGNESSPSETTVITEQPSPISVLDATFYREDPPSPIKKKSDISKDSDAAQNADDEKEENSSDLTSPTKYNVSNWASDGDLNTQYLVQKLQKTDCPHDEAIDFIGPLSDSKDPDHQYISEIMFALDLISSPGSSKRSAHLNGTKLFLALEQIKTKKRPCDIEDNPKTKGQMQRKLVFDVVYDILVQKLILESSPCQWFLPQELVARKLRGQQLLCEICSEFDKLRHENKNASLTNEDENLTSLLWGDLMHQPTTWTNCSSEIPDIVLDIERLIFKDLITEVVRGEVANHPGKHCRQLLFPK